MIPVPTATTHVITRILPQGHRRIKQQTRHATVTITMASKQQDLTDPLPPPSIRRTTLFPAAAAMTPSSHAITPIARPYETIAPVSTAICSTSRLYQRLDTSVGNNPHDTRYMKTPAKKANDASCRGCNNTLISFREPYSPLYLGCPLFRGNSKGLQTQCEQNMLNSTQPISLAPHQHCKPDSTYRC